MFRASNLLQTGAGPDDSKQTGLTGMKGQVLLNQEHLFRKEHSEEQCQLFLQWLKQIKRETTWREFSEPYIFAYLSNTHKKIHLCKDIIQEF